MLKNLLKYDLESNFKFLVIFYSLAIFFGVLTRFFLSIDNSFVCMVIGQICNGATISMFISILINNLMRLWVRFKNNFYGDEAYLTHTLPVDKRTLYLSKILTGIISLFVSILVIGLTLFIAYYSKENIQFVKNILLGVAEAYDSTIIKILLAFLFVFFLEFANVLQAGFTGIVLGHKMNNMKTGFSVLFGFGTYMGIQLVALLMIFVMGLFNTDIMNLFYTTEVISVEMIKVIIYMAILIYLVTFVVGYLVNVKLLKQGVNVD